MGENKAIIGKVKYLLNNLALKITGANLNNLDVASEMEKQLVECSLWADVYHLEPPKESHVKAAFDWVLFSRIADVVTIGLCLWQIYERAIMPKKTIFNDKKGLYVVIDPEHGVEWLLDGDEKDKDIFIKDFTSKVTKFKSSDELGRIYQETTTEVSFSELWIRKNK